MVRRAYRDDPRPLSRTPRGCTVLPWPGDRRRAGARPEVRSRPSPERGVQDARSDDSGLTGTSRARAQSIVRRAYLSVLKREPDPASEGYIERVLRDGWSQADVERTCDAAPNTATGFSSLRRNGRTDAKRRRAPLRVHGVDPDRLSRLLDAAALVLELQHAARADVGAHAAADAGRARARPGWPSRTARTSMPISQ